MSSGGRLLVRLVCGNGVSLIRRHVQATTSAQLGVRRRAGRGLVAYSAAAGGSAVLAYVTYVAYKTVVAHKSPPAAASTVSAAKVIIINSHSN